MRLYEKFTYRGVTLDRMTIAALLAAEKTLGYDNVIVQGSYNPGVGASAGTHDGGGAIDLVWRRRIRKQNKHLRKEGHFAGWPRPTLPGVWNRHWHGILLGNERAAPLAEQQKGAYRSGGTGLATGGQDRWKYRPDPITAFSYERAGLVDWKRLNAISRSKTKTAFTPEGRRQIATVARALRGFNMNLGKHRAGRMDEPLILAIKRFAEIRKVGETQASPLGPQVCYELCIPITGDPS